MTPQILGILTAVSVVYLCQNRYKSSQCTTLRKFTQFMVKIIFLEPFQILSSSIIGVVWDTSVRFVSK